MSSYGRYHSQSYAPSAPEEPQYSNAPPSSNYQHATPHSQTSSNASAPSNYNNYGQVSSSGYPSYSAPPSGYPVSSSGYPVSSSGYSGFPPGTNPDVIRSFQMVDRDRSGFIDENELQRALSSSFHHFNLRTIRLLMFLFKHPNEPLRIGPNEFAALWNCLGHWRGIFERYDKDRSGKIDPLELRDALYGIGYAVPGSVLQLLLSKYSDGGDRRVELGFDSFVECGMIIKGLTEKFKEKDTRRTGSATLSYDAFMSMVIPFLVSY
ncbi:probable calcium-binding protein CML48 [Gastrolobium bilobum]|uniref:probable calcium-binding protein CML48 n=1 Tax=Gastrolobium bilobum TaxID=150636 RepID=UPI002AB1A82F|nr:probable calcium-binding protein CML48 [Gastrolobium bilobum]